MFDELGIGADADILRFEICSECKMEPTVLWGVRGCQFFDDQHNRGIDSDLCWFMTVSVGFYDLHRLD